MTTRSPNWHYCSRKFDTVYNNKLFISFRLSWVFPFLFSSFLGFAHLENDSAKFEQKPSRKSYFLSGIGFSSVRYRDFATSPLFYRGPGLNFNIGWKWQEEKWEQILGPELTIAWSSAAAPSSQYFQTSTTAIFSSLSLYYHYLRKIDKLCWGKQETKLGGALLLTGNLRYNSDLGNNSLGIELITNLMFSAKISRDLSRRAEKDFHLWFIKRTLKPVERHVSFQMNIGLLNMNYRPGYAYVYDAEINGSNTSLFKYNFADYAWKINGWRLGTMIEFHKFRKSGNARKWAYVWEAAHVPGRFEPFQMASHRIQLTLMINRK